MEEAQRLYDEGMSLRDLSRHLGISFWAVRKMKLKTRSLAEAVKLIDYKAAFTEEGLKRLSEGAKSRKLGGYRPHPNRGQRYKETWFDSTWEVRVAKSLDENGISWERPKTGFPWTDQGNKYYPDFYLPDFDVYLDPKNGYLQIKDALKISEASRRNNIRILVLNEHQLDWSSIATIV